MRVSLDFETFSECNLKEAGAWVYSAHKSTEVMCIAWAENQSMFIRGVIGFESKTLRKLAADPRVLFYAFNAGFEYAIWHNVLVKKHGYPPIPIERWRDTAAVTSAHSLPRTMGMVADAMDIPTQKDKEGYDLMMKMCKPRPDGSRIEDFDSCERLLQYCKIDVKVEREISLRLGDLSAYEQKIWELDLKINSFGMRIDMHLAESIIKMKEIVKADITKTCRAAVGFNPSQVAKIKEYMTERGVEIPKVMKWKTQKDGTKAQEKVESIGAEQIKVLLLEDIPEEVKVLLRLRKEFATTSLAKADAVMRQTVADIAYYQFRYHGANPGRWTSTGIQMHNLPRGDFDSDWIDDELYLAAYQVKKGNITSFDMTDMAVLRSCLRGMLIPRRGKKFVVMDFSQIEARVLAWLAGEQKVLDSFNEGKDLYKFTASLIYKIPYEEVTKEQRFIGKMASLALGYGGGQRAFTSMAANFGVKVTKDEGETIKTDWRDRNPNIQQFWRNLEGATKSSVKAHKRTKTNMIKFRTEDDFLSCTLPSGRQIHYYQPTLKMVDGPFGKKETLLYKGSDQQKGIQWGNISTYGGKLSENITQAVARDLLADSMARLDKAGYTIIGHVHDEVIIEVDLDEPKSIYETIKDIMTTTPSWADGLPVEADGFIGLRYRK